MASVRGLHIKGVQDGITKLVDKSPRGRETLICIGSWGAGTKLQIMTEITVGGETSPLTILPDSDEVGGDVAVEINIGLGNPMYARVVGSDASTDVFVKVVPSER